MFPVKRIFALASVTALSGLLVSAVAAGCSSSDGGPSGPAEVGSDDVAVQDLDGAKPDTREPDEASMATCPSTAPIDTSDEPFKSPKPAVVGACTDADFKAMEATVKSGSVNTLSDLEMNVSAACIACAFSKGSDTMWGPIVSDVTVGTGDTTDIFNTGACLAIVSKSDDCGKSYAAFDDCLDTACAGCSDDTAQEACLPKAAQGVCNPQRQAVLSACGTSVQSYLQQCQNAGTGGCTTCSGAGGDIYFLFESYIVEQCVHDPLQTDAAAPDGG